MSTFSEIVTSGMGHVIRTLCQFLLFLQIYVTIEAFRLKRGAFFRVLACLQTAAGLVFFVGLLDGTFRETYLPFERTYPAYVNAIYSSPWIYTAVVLFALILACAGSLKSLHTFKKSHISDDAIKQTVDLLPQGICFGDAEGTAVFFNVKMDEWCRALTGDPLKSADLLRDLVTERGERRGESLITITPDGTALLFGFSEIQDGSRPYTQITASDISEQYRITSELRENNAGLMDIRERMKEFSGRAAQLAMSEELLKARVTVHDEIGHVLLRIKYYLDNPDTTDEKNLIALIRTTNDLLISDAEDPEDGREEDGRASIDDSIACAKEIGVNVAIRGALPEDNLFCKVLGRAIRECAVNTVKHAGGSTLDVEIEVLQDGISAVLTNDGSAPSGGIRETGGLASLRATAENAGYEMTVESSPSFCLTLSNRK